MRALSLVLLAATLATPVIARDDDYYRRDRRDIPSNGRWQRFGGSPVRAAIRDLQMIGSRARVGGHDRDHFYNGVDRLRRFEDRLRDGRWDGGAIDKAIEHVRHLSESDQLHPRDRSILRQHLYALRDFRSNRDQYRSRTGSWSRPFPY